MPVLDREVFSGKTNVVHNFLGQAPPELPFLSHQFAPLLRLVQDNYDLHSQLDDFRRQFHLHRSASNESNESRHHPEY